MTTDKIAKYIEVGWRDRDWYQECEDTFVSLFGRDRLHLVANLFAATSINTSLASNITLFRRALYEYDKGLPVGNYVPVMKLQLERIRKGEPLSGRKIRSFAAAMSGDRQAVVVDIWLCRAFGVYKTYFRSAKPGTRETGRNRSAGTPDKVYTQIENWVRAMAPAYGLEPREYYMGGSTHQCYRR